MTYEGIDERIYGMRRRFYETSVHTYRSYINETIPSGNIVGFIEFDASTELHQERIAEHFGCQRVQEQRIRGEKEPPDQRHR